MLRILVEVIVMSYETRAQQLLGRPIVAKTQTWIQSCKRRRKDQQAETFLCLPFRWEVIFGDLSKPTQSSCLLCGNPHTNKQLDPFWRLATKHHRRTQTDRHTTRSVSLKPRLHDTTGLTTGCIHNTAVCQTGLTTRLTTGLTTGCIVHTNIYPVVKLVWQPVWQQVVSCKRGLTVNRVGYKLKCEVSIHRVAVT